MAAPPFRFFPPRRRGKAILPGQADHSATGSPQQLEIVAEAKPDHAQPWISPFLFHPAATRHQCSVKTALASKARLNLFLPYKGGERKHPPFAGHHRTRLRGPDILKMAFSSSCDGQNQPGRLA